MNIENGIAKQTFLLQSIDVDPWYSARIDAYFSLMQEVAGMHAYQEKMGIPHLREQKKTWVVTRTIMKIHEWAQWPAQINLETWAQQPWKFYYPRGCYAYSEDNQTLLFESMTLWLIIDTETFHIIKPGTIDNEMFSQSNRNVDPQMKKRKNFNSQEYAKIEKRPITISYSDTDSNFHVNNVSYVKFLLASLDFPLLDAYQVSDIDITYLKQAFRDDNIYVHTGYPFKEISTQENFTLHHEVVKEDENGEMVVLCAAETNWRKRGSF